MNGKRVILDNPNPEWTLLASLDLNMGHRARNWVVVRVDAVLA